jgi:hypothetical protein
LRAAVDHITGIETGKRWNWFKFKSGEKTWKRLANLVGPVHAS